jgi:ABC-type antimicrobial peptide transport system permease subunit
VGVVGDAVYRSPREEIPPTVYWPLAQQPRPPAEVTLVVPARAGAPATLARAVSAAVTGVRPDVQLAARPLAEQVDATLTQERLLATLSGFFGALALLLAALGLYGLASYAVARRRVELGIRMALGTTPGGVVRLVLGRVGRLVAGGVVIGAAVGWWASALVGALLYGLAPRDPATLLGAVAVLAAVGLAAGWLPAVRAARIDPARVLRDG